MVPPKGTPEYERWKANVDAANAKRKGIPRSPEVRAKISQAKKGNVPGERISQSLMGHTISEETRAKISKKLTGTKKTPEAKANHSKAMKNRVITPELSEQYSAARRGKKNSEEHNRRLIESNRGRPMTERQREALHGPAARAKAAVSLKLWFESLSPEEQAKQVERLIKAGKSKNRDTSLELFIASQLDVLGFIYEKQKRIGRYTVDFFIPEQNWIIEVNGCFWHCCEICGIKEEYRPGQREHDLKRAQTLEDKGYSVITLWEHDIEPWIKRLKEGMNEKKTST